MSYQPTPRRSQNADEILDLLLDALLERNAQRRRQAAAAQKPAPAQEPKPEAQAQPEDAPEPPPQRKPQPGDADWTPPPAVPSMGLHRLIWRMLLAVLVVTVLINIPVTRYGVSLARILPDKQQLVVRDGLLLKGSGPEVYRLEDEKLRWVSSLDAFHHLGLAWDDVHQVDDAYLDSFERGEPIHVLLKCRTSPHIYRLEGDQKRWIKDIATFRVEGHHWDEVRFVECDYLDSIPLGTPIPANAGRPPDSN